MILKKISQLDTIEPGMPDDLFIGCVSFEERCRKALVSGKDYKTKHIMLFFFPELGPREKPRVKDNFKTMQQAAEKRKEKGGLVEIVRPPRSDARAGFDVMVDTLRQLVCKAAGQQLRITLDITTFTKSYLLVLLKALENAHLKDIQLVYVEPAYYVPERLTAGVRTVGYVPLYNGHPSPSRPDLLVTFLGFEGDRAYAIWEHFEPEKTIAFVGNPGYDPTYPECAERLNASLLNEPGIEKRDVPPRDPDAVCHELESIWADHKEYNLLIAPLGTKPETLGVYLFKRRNPDCPAQVVYATAGHYFEEYYSRGSGRMWCGQLAEEPCGIKPSKLDG